MRPMRYSTFCKLANLIKARLTGLSKQVLAFSTTEELSEIQLSKIKVIDETASKKYAEFEATISKLFSGESADEDIKDAEVLLLQEEISDLYIQIHSTCNTLAPASVSNHDLSHGSAHTNQPEPSAIRLPPLNLGVFSGQPEKWIAFHSLFESTVHKSSNLSDVEKFSYLLSCLSGDPLHLVKSLPLTSANYHIAYNQLCKRYSNSRLLISLHVNNILDISSLHNCSGKQLRSFVTFFQENTSALNALGHDFTHESLFLTFYILRKFDNDLRSKFEHSRRDSEIVPNISELLAFVEKECAHMEAANLSLVSSNKSHSLFPQKMGTCAYSRQQRTTTFPKTALLSATSLYACVFCSAPDHTVYRCSSFSKLIPEERLKFVQTNSLCNNCLNRHNVRNCQSRRNCNVCKLRHHTLLHLDRNTASVLQQSTNSKKQQSAVSFNEKSTNPIYRKVNPKSDQFEVTPPQSINPPTAMVGISHSSSVSVLLATARIQISANNRSIVVRAVLDSAAQHSFITESCANSLNLCQYNSHCSQILGISSSSVSTKGFCQVTISTLEGQILAIEHPTIILEQITNNLPSHLISSKVRGQVNHLVLADPNFDVPAPVDALIGADLFPQIFLGEVIRLGINMPSAFSTIFGYVLMGSSPTHSIQPQNIRYVNLLTTSTSNIDLHNAIQKFWLSENPPEKSLCSRAETECELHFKQTHYRRADGRYVVRLPLKESPAMLGDSSIRAHKMLISLERTLSHNTELKERYLEFMRDYAESGHMIPCANPPVAPQPHFYLPHHGVMHNNKIRVVFNASALTSTGISLNNILHTGQKLHNDIPDIIFNFRRYSIVFTTDAQQMFRNIWVDSRDQILQLIYWRESPTAPMQTFQLTTVTYGMSSSPFLANRVILQLLADEGQHHPLAVEALKKGLYVDDALLGADSIEEALKLQEDVVQLMKKGGFTLRKWSSNHQDILKTIPDEFKGTPLDFQCSGQPVCKVLGLKWLPEDDEFSYVTTSNSAQHTKRSVLSTIAQIYDPMGWITPIVFWAKAFMQILWTKGLQWDEPLPPDLAVNWSRYLRELPCLERVRISRHINTTSKKTMQLHGFCDASETGYCALVLLRVQYSNDLIKIYSLIAKSRVAPLKRVSLPRLELNGAHMLGKLLHYCATQILTYQSIDEVFAWCDSTITLAWIETPAYRLKTYVANRVSDIQDISIPIIWSHVPSADNPADCGSRGLMPASFQDHTLWWKGPLWLSGPSTHWPTPKINYTSIEDLPEVKPSLPASLHATEQPYWDFLRRFSSWKKLLHVTVYILRFIRHCRVSPSHNTTKDEGSAATYTATQPHMITLQEMDTATIEIMKIVQRESFAEDFIAIKKNQKLSPSLQRLSPFIDKNNLLRVGGRLSNSRLHYDAKYPILLPKHHVITDLIVDYTHTSNLHCGPQQLQSILAQKYWILSARSAIKSRIFKCIRCHRCKPKMNHPIMSDLPAPRVAPTRAFNSSAVDFAGPFNVKLQNLRRIQHSKVYICLFICLSTKATHIEVVTDLTSEAFIAALTRFISRRGLVSHLYSDNATNFTGAARLLRETIHQIVKQNSTWEYLIENGVSFHFIPPRAPHFGGLWERAIQSAKNHMKRVIADQILTMEEFNTLVCRVEAMLNSRPLVPMSSDPKELQALTPGHFLIGQPLVSLPELNFQETPQNRLKKWQLVQSFAQHIWTRWHKEYLHTLQYRPKWTQPQKNLQIGDLVIIHEDNTPPLKWKMGRVSQVFPGKDGVVRVAEVTTATGLTKRPAVKLSLLPLS